VAKGRVAVVGVAGVEDSNSVRVQQQRDSIVVEVIEARTG